MFAQGLDGAGDHRRVLGNDNVEFRLHHAPLAKDVYVNPSLREDDVRHGVPCLSLIDESQYRDFFCIRHTADVNQHLDTVTHLDHASIQHQTVVAGIIGLLGLGFRAVAHHAHVEGAVMAVGAKAFDKLRVAVHVVKERQADQRTLGDGLQQAVALVNSNRKRSGLAIIVLIREQSGSVGNPADFSGTQQSLLIQQLLGLLGGHGF